MLVGIVGETGRFCGSIFEAQQVRIQQINYQSVRGGPDDQEVRVEGTLSSAKPVRNAQRPVLAFRVTEPPDYILAGDLRFDDLCLPLVELRREQRRLIDVEVLSPRLIGALSFYGAGIGQGSWLRIGGQPAYLVVGLLASVKVVIAAL